MALPVAIITLSLQGAFPAAQPRPLTSADLQKLNAQLSPPLSAPPQLTGKALTETLVLAPYDDTTLRLALSLTSDEFLQSGTIDRLIADATGLRAEAMRQVLPEVERLLEREVKKEAEGAFRARFAPHLVATIASSAGAGTAFPFSTGAVPAERVPRQWPNPGQTSTTVAEYELVVDGKTANVREELSLIFETRQVGFRQVKRETVEQNGDPKATGKYIVETGTINADGTSTVKVANPRRLRPTSTHRVTTETIREARVARCPDAAGVSRGDTISSVAIRATAGATGTGSPSLLHVTSRGVSQGQVDDEARLADVSWEATGEARMEALNLGENFKLTNGTSVRFSGLPDGPPLTQTYSGVTGTGVGSDESVRRMHSVQTQALSDAFGPLLNAYDYAEASWREGGCVALAVASGAQPEQLPAGEARRIIVEARHRHEPEPPAIPVAGTGSQGTLTPNAPVRTPAAGFVFTSGSDGGGAVEFKSTSRRGIAPAVRVYFDEPDVETISLEYVYSGFAFVDSTPEDCPDMRPAGREVLTTRVRLIGVVDGSRRYEGTGRFSADIDGCGLTPNRKDPGQAQGGGFGGFLGDNFLGCKVTVVVPARNVRVSLRVSKPEDGSPGDVELRWAPLEGAAAPRVTSPCEPPWHAEQVKRLNEKYRAPTRLEVADEDLLVRMIDDGVLRPGSYTDPNGSSEGTWTLTVKK